MAFLMPSDLAKFSDSCFNRRMLKITRPVLWRSGGRRNLSLDPATRPLV